MVHSPVDNWKKGYWKRNVPTSIGPRQKTNRSLFAICYWVFPFNIIDPLRKRYIINVEVSIHIFGAEDFRSAGIERLSNILG